MRIMDLQPTDQQAIAQTATLLVEGFKEHWPKAWPNMDAALQEVQGSLGVDRISRIAVDEQDAVLGWIGGIRQYAGHVWELHPLVVKPDCRGQGIGRALVADLEAQVSARRGLTIWLGTDDEHNMTSLAGQTVSLSLFWILGYGGGIFLPFRDLTGGQTTYGGGGRYMLDTIKHADLGQTEAGLVIDFNYAYNPSCAYNPRWHCPLAPRENYLPLAVTAGEQQYLDFTEDTADEHNHDRD